MLTINKELQLYFGVAKKVYSSYALPTVCGTDLVWSNPDENFTVRLDLKTNTMTGTYYTYDEEAEDWTDEGDVVMTDEDLLSRIKRREFVAVKLLGKRS